MALGLLELCSYTVAFVAGIPQWIAIWLGIKTASGYTGWQNLCEELRRPVVNTALIGNLLAILVSLVGATIALGRCPLKSCG